MELGKGVGRREYRCRFVRAGQVRAAGNRPGTVSIEPAALQAAVTRGLFDARAVFVDHAGWFDYPSLQRLAGVTAEAEYNHVEATVEGKIRLYDTELGETTARLLDEMLAEGAERPDVGLSIVFWPVYAPRDNESDPRRIVDVKHVESVDLVFEPAADGRILEALSAAVMLPSAVQGSGEMERYGEELMRVNGAIYEGGAVDEPGRAKPGLSERREPQMVLSGGSRMEEQEKCGRGDYKR